MVKKQKSTEVAKARTFEDLLEIEKERGYKRGWARNMIRFRNTTEFNRLMSDADNFIRVENYSKARERFDKALEMNIDNSKVNESIQMLEMLIQEKFQEII